MFRRITNSILKHKIKSVLLFVGLVFYIFCLPDKLFDKSTSTVIESTEGELLGALIADDGQWRFPASDSIPKKFEQCIIQFEDAHFYKHFGFNPISIFKALKANISEGKVVRGGSTITQQVIRLSREGKSRTYFEKLIELVLATRLEFRSSKEDILNYYASNAPYGGNVVGLEVASWRYFGVQPHQLSWAESATLAVLPNAPSLIYPGKNQEKLRVKRNRLLKKLFDEQIIDKLTYELAIQEDLPQKPYPMPQLALHLLQEVAKSKRGQRIKTSIEFELQNSTKRIVNQHYDVLKQNEVHNMAVLVLDVETRKVLSYIGNTETSKLHQKDVNIINAPRSTGSTLKPLLYMAMLDKGEILPDRLVADIPTTIADYVPKNFNLQYAGAIPAKKALARSLNIPAVRMLQQYGLTRFYDELTHFNFNHINKGVDHYGLSLILGGAESSLWDLCTTYGVLASEVNNFTETSSEYYQRNLAPWSFENDYKVDLGKLSTEKNSFDAGSIYLAFEAMKEVNRPDGDESWKFYDSSKEIAWKTGTSFGNRDAWAIGLTPKYVVGVWVGNADGEGRPELTGVSGAAPVLFDVFNLLPNSKWFDKPFDELSEATICKQSGYLAGENCDIEKKWITTIGKRSKSCPYHQLIHVDNSQQFRVNATCESIDNIQSVSWFSLPPIMEWYYKKYNSNYKSLPPLRSDCKGEDKISLDFIFPKPNATIILPKNEGGAVNPVIMKIAHSRPDTKVYWYIDDEFLQATITFHEIGIKPKKGVHTITAVDEYGNEVKRNITIE